MNLATVSGNALNTMFAVSLDNLAFCIQSIAESLLLHFEIVF